MPSDNNHIDNFFRFKAGEAEVDTTRVDTDWQKMQNLLKTQPPVPVEQPVAGSGIKKYFAYTAGVIVILTAALLILPGKKKTGKKVSHVTAIAKKVNPATPVLPASKKTVTPPVFEKKHAT